MDFIAYREEMGCYDDKAPIDTMLQKIHDSFAPKYNSFKNAAQAR